MRLLPAGLRLGSYELIELVGRGGMGEVYKAFDVVLRRHAAVKVLPDDGATDDERVQRFLREARAASALNHPNIVTIYDAGSAAIAPGQTTHYIAMELVDGSTLRPKLSGASVDELLPIFIQVADALAKAHEAGVVHRDLKPENILVRADGVAKIVDFGLAKSFGGLTAGESFETHEGVLVGTFAYMSPEQVDGGRVDGRSDMFAFGSMLFEVITGVLPFVAGSALETLRRIACDAPRWSGGGTTGGTLQQIVDRCLAKHPDDRYATMAEVAAALRASRTEAAPGARPERPELAAALSPAALEVVNVAAVIGRTVSIRELRDLLDDDVLDDAIDELMARHILVEEDKRAGTFRFASASAWEDFYSRVPRRRRKEIHAACAAHGERLLGARPATAALLRHFHSAGVSAKVVEYGPPLLRDLVERVRLEEAIDVADLVAEAAGHDLASVLEATELLARAYAQLGDFDRALARIDAMRPVLEASPDALTRLARTAAQVAWEARRVDVAERWIRRGLAGSGKAGETDAIRDLLALATTIATVTGDTAAADAYALRLTRAGERPAAKVDARGGRIVVPSTGSLQVIDPQTDVLWRNEIESPIFETLTRVAADGRIVPWLAAFEANADSTAFRFRLREGLRFHNGRLVTSEDVAFTYTRLLRQHGNASRWALAPIRGAKAVADGAPGMLEGFRCHSDREFTIELAGPVAVFPAMASFPGAGVIPVESDVLSGTWKETCVGTGPYRVVRFEPNRRLELEANPFYWRDGLPRTGRLAFVMGLSSSEILERFRSRELTLARDLSDGDFWTLRRDAELRAQYAESPRLSTYFLAANRHKGPFADPVLRRTVFDIDVEAVLRASRLPLIRRAHTLSPPGLIGHVRSPAATPHLSATAVLPRVPVTLGVLSGFHRDHRAICERLVQALTTHGLIVDIVEIDPMNFNPAARAACDLVAGRWYADYPDAYHSTTHCSTRSAVSTASSAAIRSWTRSSTGPAQSRTPASVGTTTRRSKSFYSGTRFSCLCSMRARIALPNRRLVGSTSTSHTPLCRTSSSGCNCCEISFP